MNDPAGPDLIQVATIVPGEPMKVHCPRLFSKIVDKAMKHQRAPTFEDVLEAFVASLEPESPGAA